MMDMPPKERAVDRGSRRGTTLVSELGAEIRRARVEHGLSQAFVGANAALSRSEVSRIERGRIGLVSILSIARLMSVVGLELSARAYPTGAPLRDRAQLELLARFHEILPPTLSWRTEVPVGPSGDLRAWDAVVARGPARAGVEAETRLTDLQAVERRIALKCRDSAIPVALLLIGDTRLNRMAARSYGPVIQGSFPIAGRDAIRILEAGRLPEANALILI